MSAKHSPAPWMALPYDEGRSYGHADWTRFSIQSGGPNEYEIAAIIGDVAEIPAEANARLIAAAPEMLRALKEAVDLIESHTMFDATPLHALISKAEGRS